MYSNPISYNSPKFSTLYSLEPYNEFIKILSQVFDKPSFFADWLVFILNWFVFIEFLVVFSHLCGTNFKIDIV